jgi:hypothetical protein
MCHAGGPVDLLSSKIIESGHLEAHSKGGACWRYWLVCCWLLFGFVLVVDVLWFGHFFSLGDRVVREQR